MPPLARFRTGGPGPRPPPALRRRCDSPPAAPAPRSGTEHAVLVRDLQAEREQDLALGVEAARAAGLDAVDGERREPRLSGELRLAHHERLAESLYVVARHAPPSGRKCLAGAPTGLHPGRLRSSARTYGDLRRARARPRGVADHSPALRSATGNAGARVRVPAPLTPGPRRPIRRHGGADDRTDPDRGRRRRPAREPRARARRRGLRGGHRPGRRRGPGRPRGPAGRRRALRPAHARPRRPRAAARSSCGACPASRCS